jgi:hypothetical protein
MDDENVDFEAKDSRRRAVRGFSAAHMKTTAFVYKSFPYGNIANDNHEINYTLHNYRYEENRNQVRFTAYPVSLFLGRESKRARRAQRTKSKKE